MCFSNERQSQFGNIPGNILQSSTNMPPRGRASLCFSLSVGCENRLTAWGEVLQSGRTRNLGHFASHEIPTSGPLAQYSELATDNRLVGSSSPPGPTTNLLGALYAALRIETPTYKRCDGGAMYHQEKGEAFSATAPYLSLGGTEQSTRWRNPMGKSGRSNKKGRPNKRTKRLMKLEEKRRRNASRRKSVRGYLSK